MQIRRDRREVRRDFALEPYRPGDFVILYLRPELVPPGGYQGLVKRLVTMPPSGITFPHREHPESELASLVIAEQLNPPRRYAIRCDSLLAIHKCLGPVPADLKRVRMTDEEIEAMALQGRAEAPRKAVRHG